MRIPGAITTNPYSSLRWKIVLGEYLCLSLKDGQLYFPSTIFRPPGTENVIYAKLKAYFPSLMLKNYMLL